MKHTLKIIWTETSYGTSDEYTITDVEKRALMAHDGARPLCIHTETGDFKVFDPRLQIKRLLFKPIPEAKPELAPKKEEIQLPASVNGLDGLETKPTSWRGTVGEPWLVGSPKYEFDKIKLWLRTGKTSEAFDRLTSLDVIVLRQKYPVVYRSLLIEAAAKSGSPVVARNNLTELEGYGRTPEAASMNVVDVPPFKELEAMVLLAESKAKVDSMTETD